LLQEQLPAAKLWQICFSYIRDLKPKDYKKRGTIAEL